MKQPEVTITLFVPVTDRCELRVALKPMPPAAAALLGSALLETGVRFAKDYAPTGSRGGDSAAR